MIVHAHKNDLTEQFNSLNSFKKILKKRNKFSPSTRQVFSEIILRKDKASLVKIRRDTNGRLKKLCQQKGIAFIEHDNLDEQHLGMKKLFLYKKGSSAFADNVLKLFL